MDTHNLLSMYPIPLRHWGYELDLWVLSWVLETRDYIDEWPNFNSNICTNVKYTKLDDQEALPCLPPLHAPCVHESTVERILLTLSIVKYWKICYHRPSCRDHHATYVYTFLYTQEKTTRTLYSLSPFTLKVYIAPFTRTANPGSIRIPIRVGLVM